MKKLFLMLLGMLLLTTTVQAQNVITAGYVYLNFDDTNPVWPAGWQNGRLSRQAQEGVDNTPCTRVNLYSWTAMETTFFQSPAINMGDNPTFSMKMKITRRVGGLDEEVLTPETPITYSMSISDDNGATWHKLMEVLPGNHPANADYMLFSPDVSAYANKSCMVRFDASTPLPATSFGTVNHYIRLDDIIVGTPPASDLAATAIAGTSGHKEGVEAHQTVTVMNTGVTQQDTYTVKLMSIDKNKVCTEVGSRTVTGQVLNPQQTADIDVAWTPAHAGNMTIYGKVVGVNDSDPSNDSTKNITVNVWQANDLAARMVSGNATPTVNQSAIFSVTLENLGHREQKSYTIKLMQARQGGDVELASQLIQNEGIAANMTRDVRFAWTPTTVGAVSLYAIVELEGDFNPDNNKTDKFNIDVQPQGTFTLSIGAGNEKTHLPYNFQYSKSLSQSLYFPHELGMVGGEISKITYKADITSTGAVNDNMKNIAIQVWIGETDKDNLADAYVDPSTLTLVYDGRRDFPTGEYDVTIDLIQPYKYKGGNLVVYSYMNNELYGGYADLFLSSDFPNSSRTRHWYNDNFPDPENPDATSGQHRIYHGIPNTRFQITEASINSFGSVQGVVSDDNGALANAKVMVEGTKYAVTTNAEGEYSMPMLAAGEYTLRITKYGYNTISKVVTVVAKEPTLFNAQMTPRRSYTFAGRVKSYKSGAGVENATVKFNCEDTYVYTATTDAQGTFTFEEDGNPVAISEGNYQVTISADDMDTYVGTLNLTANVSDFEFILHEIPYAVAGVQISEEADAMKVSWGAPVVPEGKSSSLEGYAVYRSLKDAPKAEWTLLADNIAKETLEFTDAAWKTLPWGVYQYAVIAKYPDSQLSVAVISADAAHDMYVAYTVTAVTNLGTTPTGATVTLANIDGKPEHTYTVALADDGAKFDAVWRGMYNLSIAKLDFIRPFNADSVIVENEELTYAANVEEIPYAAINPKAEMEGEDHVVVSWSKPKTFNEWCTYVATDIINGGMAPLGYYGEELTTAIRYTPKDLKAFGVINGQYITQVALGIARNIQTIEKMQIQIWEGGTSVEDAGELVYTQDITNIIGNDAFSDYTWVTIDLTTPYAIDPTKEVRIGWTVPNIDGKVVQGIGPRESAEGPVWNNGKMTLWKSSAGMNYWKDASLMQGGQFRNCIKTFISNDPTVKSNAVELGEESTQTEVQPIIYNVYRFAEADKDDKSKWVNVAEDITALFCEDVSWIAQPKGMYQYAVVAGYAGEDAEPVFSNLIEKMTKDVEEIGTTEMSVYPNPTSDWVNVVSNEVINALYLFDVSGKLVMSETNLNATSTRVDLSALTNGIYFLKVNNKVSRIVKK